MSASKESSPGGSGPVAQTGRKLGPRAIRTRDRILDATAKLLDERSVLDISHTSDALGWMPAVDVATGLEKTVAWFKEQERA